MTNRTKQFKVFTLASNGFNEVKKLQLTLSNSLIIYAALTQPEHRILVRWMGLETQGKTKTRPCLQRFQTRMQIFLICILIKQEKHFI